MQLFAGRAFQIEETTSAKALRLEFPGGFKCVSVWLEHSGLGAGSIIGDR